MTDTELENMMARYFGGKPMEWSDEIFFDNGDRRYCLSYDVTSTANHVALVKSVELLDISRGQHDGDHVAQLKHVGGFAPVDVMRGWVVRKVLDHELGR